MKVRERREPTAKMDTRMAQYAKCRCTHIMRQPKQICSGLDKHLRGAMAWTVDDRTSQSHDAAISSSCRSRKRILKTRQRDNRTGTRLGLEAVPPLHAHNQSDPNKSRESAKIGTERLSKVLQAAGVASRRGADALISQNRVSVTSRRENCERLLGHEEVQPFTRVDINKDIVSVDGRRIDIVHSFDRLQTKVYVALYKPKGYVCSTASNPGNKKKLAGQTKHTKSTRSGQISNAKPVLDLVKPLIRDLTTQFSLQYQSRDGLMDESDGFVHDVRLFTVGRLDVNTSGLLLITNDGDWSHKVMHPSSNVEREYMATVAPSPSRRQLSALAQGCMVDGKHIKPLEVHHEGKGEKSKLFIVVGEGRYHEVRELIKESGMSLKTLKRIRIGGLRLNKLGIQEGQYTCLGTSQVNDVLSRM